MFFQNIFWNWKHVINQSKQGNCFVLWKERIICATFCVSFWLKLKARGGTKSKNKHPSWLYCSVVGLSGAATGGVL